MRPRSTCTRVMGREDYGEGKELLMILSIPPHQWSMVVVVSWRGHVWLPVELVSLVFIDDVTADKSSRMNSEVFRAILSAHIQPNASELIGRRFTVQMDNDPKHTAKATKEFLKGKKWTVMQWPSQSPDLNPIEHAFSLAEDKTEGKMPQEQAGTEDGCSRGLAEHHQGWNPASGDVYAFQTSGCNWLQRICNQVLKSESLIYDYYSVPLLLVPYKWEAHMQTVVIPTPFTWFGCKYPQIKADSLQLKHILLVSFEIHCGGV